MKNSSLNNRATLMLLTLLLLIASTATQARSQTIEPRLTPDTVETSQTTPIVNPLDKCTARLDKTLDAFEKSQAEIAAKDAKLLTADALIADQKTYNSELLKSLTMLVSSEKRDKSFFRKLLDQLGRVLKTATDPTALTTIATLIVVTRKLAK